MKKNLVIIAIIFGIFPVLLFAQDKEWDPRLLQATELAYQGNYPAAQGILKAYVSENPLDPNGYFLQANMLDWKRNLTSEESREVLLERTLALQKKANQIAFHRWNKDSDNPDRLIDLGNSYLFLGRVYSDLGSQLRAVLTAKKARKHLEKASKINPDRVDGLMALGVFHYVADNTPSYMAPLKGLFGIKGNKAEGLAELKKSLTATHPYQNDALVALYHINFEFEKNYPMALKYLSQLETKYPKNPLWRYSRAEIYAKQDKGKGIDGFLQVIEWCQNGAACDVVFPFKSYFEAGKLAKELNQSEKARDYLSRALQMVPSTRNKNKSEILFILGQMDEKSGQQEMAAKKYQRAQEVPAIPKDQKKKIQEALLKLCKADNPPKNC